MRRNLGKHVFDQLPGVPGPEQSLRIAAVGGSTTFGIGSSDDAHAWPALLESKLNKNRGPSGPAFEVVNAGLPGATSGDVLIFFRERVLKLNPDIALIYSGWNDWNEFCARGPAFFEYGSIPYRLDWSLSEMSVLYSKMKNLFFSYKALVKSADYEKRARRALSQDYFGAHY